jgi:hypothetical protein
VVVTTRKARAATKALATIDAEPALERKTARFNGRCRPSELALLQAAAAAEGVAIGVYLVRAGLVYVVDHG